LRTENIFAIPLQPSALDELVVNDPNSDFSAWPLADVLFKMIHIPTGLAKTIEFFVAPIIFYSLNS
jgi:hypothetical protein